MKSKYIFLPLLLIMMMLSRHPAQATHQAGIDLTLHCIGGNTYVITFVLYRDCSGIPAPGTAYVHFTCSSHGALNFSVNLPPIPGTGQEVTTSCTVLPTTCGGGTLYGIREWVYRDTIILPPCNTWKTSWSDCCRNANTNVVNSVNTWTYIEATLNNADFPCSGTPYFSNIPNSQVCLLQPYCYNHGAIDPDGDSLSYSLVNPATTGPGTSVNWFPPYNANQPILSTPPVTLNPLTGDICMTPTMLGKSFMAVKVEKWRRVNGVLHLVGSTIRDMQINVIMCLNQLPQLGGIDTTMAKGYDPADSIRLMTVCLGDSVNFAIWGYDPDQPDPNNIGSPEIFRITWNSGIPQGTFTTYHDWTDSAYAIFRWLPTVADVGNILRCFTATVEDAACPYHGSQTFSYCFVVRSAFAEIGNDTLICQGEQITFQAHADTNTVNYLWTLNGLPAAVPLQSSTFPIHSDTLSPGQYTVAIKTNDGHTTVQCPGKDQLILTIVPMPDPQLGNDTMICEPSTLTLDAGPGVLYQWSTGEQTQSITIHNSGLYTVTVDGGNNTRCTAQAQIGVVALPVPVIQLVNDTCAMEPFPISAGAGSAFLLWNTGDTTPVIIPQTSGTYTVTATYIPGTGCDATPSTVVLIHDFGWPEDTTICPHHELLLFAPEPPAGYPFTYQWEPGEIKTPNYTFFEQVPGNYLITLNMGGSCQGEIMVTVDPCLITIPNVFTPNNDGVNDRFEIKGVDEYPGSIIYIYNRWGVLVHSSNDYNSSNFWDGAGYADGVYFYLFRLKTRNAKGDVAYIDYHGSVTMLGSH
jgi:gliding motility-associated-like protein